MGKTNRQLIKKLIITGILFWWGIPYDILKLYLTKKYRSKTKQLMNDLESLLVDKYKACDLIETSNRLQYEFSLNCPRGTTEQILPRYSPLFEPEIVSIGYNLLIKDRINCKFYRDEIGILNNQLSEIETFPVGHLLSANKKDYLLDFFNLAKYQLKNIKSLSSYFPIKNESILENYILSHPDLKKALTMLIEKDVISDKIILEEIDYKLGLNIINLYYLMTV